MIILDTDCLSLLQRESILTGSSFTKIWIDSLLTIFSRPLFRSRSKCEGG